MQPTEGGVVKTAVLLSLVGWALASPPLAAQQASGDAKTLRLLRTASGTRGAQKGALFEMDDPRSSFTLPEDRQVVVYFEWEGSPGLYRCEGRWKDPSGRVVLVAPTEYLAKTRRFGIRWTLALPDGAANGLWALEVVVDGQSFGMHAFSIASPTPPAEAKGPSADEIYKSASRAVVGLMTLGPDGAPLGAGTATALDGDHVATSLSTVEGATRVRARLGGGRSAETETIQSWGRREGWVVVGLPAHGLTPLPRAGRRPAVGDRVFVLDATENAEFSLRETRIVGDRKAASGKTLLRIEQNASSGSPVLNTSGEVFGLLVSGSPDPELGGMAMSLVSPEKRREFSTLVVPLDLIPATDAAPARTLTELAAQKIFAKPLSQERRSAISGVFASRVDRSANVPMPLDQKMTFSRREGSVSVFLQWAPLEKRDAVGGFEIYDLDNRVLGKSDPTKLKFRSGERIFTTWTFTIDKLPPGIYRVDGLLGEEPAWRGYLQITE